MTDETLTNGQTNTDAAGQQQGATTASGTTDGQGTAQQTAAGNTDAKTGEGEAATSTKESDKTDDAVPETYSFTAPEGVELNTETTEEFSALAKELGLSQTKAQKLVDLGAKLTERVTGKQSEAINATMQKMSAEWGEQTKTDKELGGDKLDENMAVAKKAIDAFGSPELSALLGNFHPEKNPKGTGLGNHPEIIRAFYKAGKAISEDAIVGKNTGGSPVDADPASVLFPNMKNKSA